MDLEEKNRTTWNKIKRSKYTLITLGFVIGICLTGTVTHLTVLRINPKFAFEKLPIIDRMTLYYQSCRNKALTSTWFYHLQFYIDLIFHNTRQSNAFTEIDKQFESYPSWNWLYGNSMNDSWFSITNHLDDMDKWNGSHSIVDLFSFIYNHVSPYEDDFNYGPHYAKDFVQAPLETLYRGMGDCEDYSILGSAIFENNGYETLIASISDSSNERFGENGLQHVVFFVKMSGSGSRTWFLEEDNSYWFLIDVPFMRDEYEYYSIEFDPIWIDDYPSKTLNFSDWTNIMSFKIVK